MENEEFKEIRRKKENQKFIILGIITFIILSILTIQNLVVFSIEQLKKPIGQKETTTTICDPVVVEEIIEQIGSCPGSGREVPSSDLMGGGDRFHATAAGQAGTFCNQAGTPFYHESKTGAATISLSDLHSKAVPVRGTLSYVRAQTYGTPYSFPQLYCKMHDVDFSQSAPDIAFAVASGGSQEDIQKAVWGMGTNREVSTPKGPLQLGNDIPFDSSDVKLTDVSSNYADFKELADSYKNSSSSTSLNLSVNTDEALVQVDYDKQILIIGPIYIDYPAGGPFGGISDMFFEGINSSGSTVQGQERIEINNYGADPDKIDQKLNFFNPNRDVIEGTQNNKTLMDESNEKSYPAPGKGFYVTINNPNKGLSGSYTISESITKKEHLKISTVVKVKLHYKYQWMEVTNVLGCYAGAFVEKLTWTSPAKTNNMLCGHHTYDCYDKDDPTKLICRHRHNSNCYEYISYPKIERTEVQNHLIITKIIKKLFEQEIIVEIEIPIEIDIEVDVSININVNIEGAGENTMMIGGKVWEDTFQGKDGQANKGILDKDDKILPNVKVTLYEVEKGKETQKPGKITSLILSKTGTTKENVMNTINPTYTNEDGEYLFIGVDPLKKYYVEFEYNGQTYIPTEYKYNDGKPYSDAEYNIRQDYNSENWKITSKGTETPSQRDAYNLTFSEIGSSPANYKSTNSMGWLDSKTGGYNQAFSQYDLMGFVLNEEGNYTQGLRLIDSYYKIDDNGNIVETSEFQEGEISKAIKKYIQDELETPDENAIKKIYEDIAGDNQEIRKMLQFVEDTKIHSYTQQQGAENYDLYPIYNQFTLNVKSSPLPRGFYPGIYGGQLYINQGLRRREETDISLRKDALYAATRINGKTEVYEYNKRDKYTEEQTAELKRLRKVYEENGRKKEDYQKYLEYKTQIENNDNYWQIQLRMRDYNNYYGTTYSKELYQADYNYRSMNTNWAGTTPNQNKDLELYVTYKVTVRNASQSILDEVTEIVDFYDKDYTYRDDLSWVMYKNNSNSSIAESVEEIAFTETDYYNTIHNLSLQGNIKNNNKGTNSSSNSQYEARTSEVRSDMTQNYNDVYIKGLEGKKLASGEEAYVYLTFQVNSDSKGPVIIDENDSLKYNYAEINGYKTYYKDGTELPNGINKGSEDVAGIIDINSTPGNLCQKDLQGNKYEKNFENDADRAKGIKITVEENFIRSINGTVWEDERTQNVSNSLIGDGVRTSEIGIEGVTVELVEKLERGGEYVWQRTTTDENGKYEFKTDRDLGTYIIPGNYIIRFRYGDTYKTVRTEGYGEGKNAVSYNGQDFKSTVYQKDMTNGKEVGKVADEYYDIRLSDAFGKNISDAKDLYTKKTENVTDRLDGNKQETKNFLGREDVINYSNNAVTNHKAEVMASPYEAPEDMSLINELMANTNMTAETAIIVLEGEYNRTGTDGYKAETNNVDASDFLFGNDKNGNYTLNNIDLGLSERPKAGLELGKKITNVKITLANGNILFDAIKSMDDLSWTAGSPYELDKVGLRDKANKYQEFYNSNHRYAYRNRKGNSNYNVDSLVASKYDSSGNNGLLQIIMDEELMHGATIKISYELSVTNVGEKDFEGQNFYYKGTDANKVVTTSADAVLDYVANNLQFREADNTTQNGWKAVNNVITSTEINQRLAQSVAKYNTVVQTSNLNKALTPKENGSQEADYSTKAGLVLTQLITPENNQDDKTYNNIAEITKVSNTVGRRMAYSIQGNQDPLKIPQEVDSIKSEQVVILPPFGIGNWIVYTVLAAGVLAILAVGIILIKKKVLDK